MCIIKEEHIMRKLSKRIISLALVAAMSFSMTGCEDTDRQGKKIDKDNNLTQNVKDVDIETKDLDKEFIYSTADFSVNIFKESTNKDISAGKNVLISPQSIITAMSMTTNGASGDTLSQLEKTMYGGMSVEKYNKYINAYSAGLTEVEQVKFNMANSIWIKNDNSFTVEDDFLQTCKSYYNAQVYKTDFDAKSIDEINGWVEDNTDGMIDSIIKSIPEAAVMYLINAIAFEGEWQVQYKDSQIQEDISFINYSGNEEKVTMLRSGEEYYLEDDMARGFMKYYKGGDYAFLAMLPDENVDILDYVNSLTGEKLVKTYNNREYLGDGNVMVGIPEFTYAYEKELSKDFTSLGVTDAFDGDLADFSKLGRYEGANLFINGIFHKTYISLDRNGTKAAAVTAVEVANDSCAMPDRVETVILDRPFYYAIIDCNTGLPVFMGVVNSVN